VYLKNHLAIIKELSQDHENRLDRISYTFNYLFSDLCTLFGSRLVH